MALISLHDVPAPAKINLFLHVTGRRTDGYHLLSSLFVLIDWADVLHLERRDDGRLVRHDLGPALPADDLCLRAARALQQASGTAFGADISIDKRVPWGAGLGGGSSDAATTLLALNRLWGLDWPRERLAAIGLALGADVPFFVGGRNAYVTGIGEVLSPVAVAPLRLAIVKPAASIATKDVFTHPLLRAHVERSAAASAAAGAGEAAILRSFLEGSADLPAGSGPLPGRNDLQAPAEAVSPEVAQAARWLETRFAARPGASRMSGSGSAVFLRLTTDSSGSAAPDVAMPRGPARPPPLELQGLPEGWTGRVCRSLQVHPLADWAPD